MNSDFQGALDSKRSLEIELNTLRTTNESTAFIYDRETKELVSKLENLKLNYN
jgi:hypothetical protein